jgi:hypothetical protein
MSKKRITYTAAFKAKVALTAAKQEKTISQLAAQFKVHPIVISRWKAQLLENAESIFYDGRLKKKSDDPNIDDIPKMLRSVSVNGHHGVSFLSGLGVVVCRRLVQTILSSLYSPQFTSAASFR